MHSVFSFGSFRDRICWEEEEECGGGAYTPDYKYWIYVSMSSFMGPETEDGAYIVEQFGILDRETATNLKIKYPRAGSEKSFRRDLEQKIGVIPTKNGEQSGAYALISECPLEQLGDESAKFVLNIDDDFHLSTGIDRRQFSKALELLSEVLDDEKSLSEFSTAKGTKENGWFDSIELKPGLFGIKVDLKKLYSVTIRRKR